MTAAKGRMAIGLLNQVNMYIGFVKKKNRHIQLVQLFRYQKESFRSIFFVPHCGIGL